MADIKMNISPEVILGSEKRLGDEVLYWGNRVLVIGDASIKEQIHSIRESLESRGLRVLLFTDVEPELATYSLNDALSMARGSRADMILGIGGVKTLQMARAAAALTPGDIFLEDYFQGRARPNKGLPYIEVPSSGRNPFMLRQDCLLTETRNRRSRIVPLPDKMVKMVLLDPLLTTGLSDRNILMILMEILLSAVENYLVKRSSFFSDVQSRASIGKAAKVLFGYREQGKLELTDRHLLCESALFSAYSSALNGVGPVTLLTYALSNYSNVPKSSVATVLLPFLVSSNFYPPGEKKDSISNLCDYPGFPEDFRVEDAAETFRRAQGLYELPSRLSALGLNREQLSEAASIAFSITENLYPDVTQDNLLDILNQAF
ncbi:MAG: iron-containing alcohol dehydrogenase [Spirochaetaceae bacterium]|jgi:alcohol dehydrogenase class IV|nr:iron-containing alcohol dehydrogenase [Spirochaetaceae bacterium]